MKNKKQIEMVTIELPEGLRPEDPAMLIHPFGKSHKSEMLDKPGIHGERGPKGERHTVGDCSGDIDTDQLVFAAAVAVDQNGKLWIRGGSGRVCKWRRVAQ